MSSALQVQNLRESTRLNRQEIKLFEEAIKGLKIRVSHRPGVNRVYRVTNVGNSADEIVFVFITVFEARSYSVFILKKIHKTYEMLILILTVSHNNSFFFFRFEFRDDNSNIRSVTVAEYFADRYRPLKYPKLPCVQVGSSTRCIYFPIEVCILYAPQKYNKKLSEQQTSAIIKVITSNQIINTKILSDSSLSSAICTVSNVYLCDFIINCQNLPLQIDFFKVFQENKGH